MGLIGRAFVASANQVWNLSESVTSLGVSESCCYLWVFCFLRDELLILLSNRKTSGRWFWPRSVQLQSHIPDVYFCCQGRAFAGCVLGAVCRCRTGFPELPQPGEEHRRQLCSSGISQALRTSNAGALTLLWGLWGKTPALWHLNSSTEAPQTDLSSSESWRIRSSKLFIKNTHLIISKRTLKDAQGQSVNRKRGLNSPNKLFADWIIHGECRAHLEGFDWGCQLLWSGKIPQNLAFSKAPLQYSRICTWNQMWGWSFPSLTPGSTWC